ARASHLVERRRPGRRTLSESADAALGQAALDEMTRASGGTSYFPQTEGERELFGVCARIALELRSQYTVGFYPAGESNAPRLHNIRVSVSPSVGSGSLHLSYREGYRPRKD
ncbi:MAG TPA: hypothetical protein VNZ44_01180, partial [Pyrinomonadaceae bacterium]|nr:hypothetical protein [Pyrinomonadaceae bacterium]